MTQQNNDVQAALDTVSNDVIAMVQNVLRTSDSSPLSFSRRTIEVLLERALAQQQPDAGFSEVFAEIEKAVRKFPTWPTDPLHALAVLGEEFGELTKSTLQLTYEPHKTNIEEFRTEAIQTAAMALRFYKSLDVYEFKQCEQHQQKRAEQKGGK